MDKTIYLLGLNHKTAPVEIREQFALSSATPESLGLLGRKEEIKEGLLLSTCNRVELLFVGHSDGSAEARALACWAEFCQRDAELLRPYIYTYQGVDAIRHLFTVASSLDSLVVGEPQILGQLKDAYKMAVECGTTRTVINRLMHKAFSVAKRVRTETRIANSAVSISYAAVELARHIFGDLHGRKAMLVGAGEMAELAATHLLATGVNHVLVANRTLARGEELAEQLGAHASAVCFENMFSHLSEVDIIISSTGATQTVVQARDVKGILKKRKNRPMFFIDIAVPRDIDPDVNQLDNVYLYDIDDLQEVVEENIAQRQDEAERARNIIEEEVDKFQLWLRSLELNPTIVDLFHQADALAQKEIRRTLKNLGDQATPEVEQALQTMAHSLSKKLLHQPVTFLKRRAREEDSAQEFISLTRRLFNLDNEQVPPESHAHRHKQGNE
ncbi:MAG: glutamyl-tRNA reductase [Thermodesulfobacteriota bacterium]